MSTEDPSDRVEDDGGEERYLREVLAMLRRDFDRAAKPYMDRLVQIASMRLPPRVIHVTESMGAFAGAVVHERAGAPPTAAPAGALPRSEPPVG